MNLVWILLNHYIQQSGQSNSWKEIWSNPKKINYYSVSTIIIWSYVILDYRKKQKRDSKNNVIGELSIHLYGLSLVLNIYNVVKSGQFYLLDSYKVARWILFITPSVPVNFQINLQRTVRLIDTLTK